MSFSGYTETAHNGSQVFRHVYITKSSDGGTTWKDPVDVTPHTIWDGAQECVFASMNPVVDDKIRIVYQKDFEPGLAVRGDEDMVDNNEIIYLEIDTAGLFSPTWSCDGTTGCFEEGPGIGTYTSLFDCTSLCYYTDIENTEITNLKLYPNPAGDIVTVEAISKIKAIEILNVLGQTLHTKADTNDTEKISVSELNSGNYFIKVTTEKGSETIRLLKK